MCVISGVHQASPEPAPSPSEPTPPAADCGAVGAKRPSRATYGVVRVLGKGSFGTVYLVLDRNERRHYVMKVIELSGMSGSERAAARGEVDVMRQLQHPNIVGFRESFLRRVKGPPVDDGRGGSKPTDARQLCIIMAHCDGGDLQRQLRDQRRHTPAQPFSEAVCMNWFVQLCLGLHFMHARNVLHRDIKLANVFLLGSGRLVLGDLGVSKILHSGDRFASTQIGTPVRWQRRHSNPTAYVCTY